MRRITFLAINFGAFGAGLQQFGIEQQRFLIVVQGCVEVSQVLPRYAALQIRVPRAGVGFQRFGELLDRLIVAAGCQHRDTVLHLLLRAFGSGVPIEVGLPCSDSYQDAGQRTQNQAFLSAALRALRRRGWRRRGFAKRCCHQGEL